MPLARCPWRGSFSIGPFPTRAGQFPGTLLSSDHFRVRVVARPAWMSWWQDWQTTRVLRRRMAMRCIHAGRSGRPGRSRSASLRMWWTCKFSRAWQSWQHWTRSRWISSLRRVLAMTGERSDRTAVRYRLSGMPPNRATSGVLPPSRLMVTWRQWRGPWGVSIVVLYYGTKWPKAVAKVTDDAEALLTYFDFPALHWVHLPTTDESFKALAALPAGGGAVRLRVGRGRPRSEEQDRGAGSPAAQLCPLEGLKVAPQWRRPRPCSPVRVVAAWAASCQRAGGRQARPARPAHVRAGGPP
jgi:hypothetical protein